MRTFLFSVFMILSIISQQQNLFSDETLEFGNEAEIEQAKKWENRVYLAIYPLSGDHWMRYLIEEATHIATSSCYRDPDPQHLPNVFPWGGFCCNHGYEGFSNYPVDGDPVLIKTHFPMLHISGFENLPYIKTVRIIRHPVDTFYSFYCWVQAYYGKDPENLVPRDFLERSIASWIAFQRYWDQAENVLTIRYEDLYNASASQLKLVLGTIGYQVTEEDIQRAVEKHPPTGGLYKSYEHFTDEDIAFIQEKLGDLLNQYNY